MKKENIELGDKVILTKNISSCSNEFNKGDIVTVTGYAGYRGYSYTNDKGETITEAGFNCTLLEKGDPSTFDVKKHEYYSEVIYKKPVEKTEKVVEETLKDSLSDFNWIKINTLKDLPINTDLLVYMPPVENSGKLKNIIGYAKFGLSADKTPIGVINGNFYFDCNPITHYCIIKAPKFK